MLRRQSPAIDFPLRQPRWLRGWWCLWVGVAALLLGLWWCMGAGEGADLAWRMAVSTVLWCACAVGAWRALDRLPQGVLRWNAQHWEWLCDGQTQVLLHRPYVMVDLGSVLLLAFAQESGPTQRFLLQKNWCPSVWAGLRRAVYSKGNLAPETAGDVKNF